MLQQYRYLTFEYIGAPKPTGIPDALNSIIAPQEEPAFLTASKYFSHNFTEFLSGQKKDFFLFQHYSNYVYYMTSIQVG